MSKEKHTILGQVVRCEGGKLERVAQVESIMIHDLWHIAVFIDELGAKVRAYNNAETEEDVQMALANLLEKVSQIAECSTRQRDNILETWILAHDLKKHIMNAQIDWEEEVFNEEFGTTI